MQKIDSAGNFFCQNRCSLTLEMEINRLDVWFKLAGDTKCSHKRFELRIKKQVLRVENIVRLNWMPKNTVFIDETHSWTVNSAWARRMYHSIYISVYWIIWSIFSIVNQHLIKRIELYFYPVNRMFCHNRTLFCTLSWMFSSIITTMYERWWNCTAKSENASYLLNRFAVYTGSEWNFSCDITFIYRIECVTFVCIAQHSTYYGERDVCLTMCICECMHTLIYRTSNIKSESVSHFWYTVKLISPFYL